MLLNKSSNTPLILLLSFRILITTAIVKPTTKKTSTVSDISDVERILKICFLWIDKIFCKIIKIITLFSNLNLSSLEIKGRK